MKQNWKVSLGRSEARKYGQKEVPACEAILFAARMLLLKLHFCGALLQISLNLFQHVKHAIRVYQEKRHFVPHIHTISYFSA